MGPYYTGVPTGLIGKRQNKIKHEKEPASLPALLSKVSIVDLANYHYHLLICQLRSIITVRKPSYWLFRSQYNVLKQIVTSRDGHSRMLILVRGNGWH